MALQITCVIPIYMFNIEAMSTCGLILNKASNEGSSVFGSMTECDKLDITKSSNFWLSKYQRA